MTLAEEVFLDWLDAGPIEQEILEELLVELDELTIGFSSGEVICAF